MCSIPSKIQEMVTSQAKSLINLGNTIGDFFGNLGSNIGDFFNVLWNNILNFFKDLPTNISNIWKNFIELLQYINPWSDKFFLKIAFVMSEEQESKHLTNQEEFNNIFKNKIPFVSTLIDTFQNVVDRQNNVKKEKVFVYNKEENPLNLEINAFNYNGGVIEYNTNSTDLTYILEKYEPYRIKLRNGLMLIVYGIGIVYLVKYFLNYGITQGGNIVINELKNNSKEE